MLMDVDSRGSTFYASFTICCCIMSFPYKKVLLIGATSGTSPCQSPKREVTGADTATGIGRDLATSFIQHDRFVIAVGRRQEKLNAFVQEHGADKAAAFQLDTSQLDKIPLFVKQVTQRHPDLDCFFVNSGIQRRSVFSEPEAINMAVIAEEMNVNYISYVALTKDFPPFFQSKKDTPTSFIYTSSNLALVPILRCSNYCASKAALHHWILCLREQLKETNIRVVEVFPPIVESNSPFSCHEDIR
ncbi:short chain dehydrogenase family protein [Aspergillus niger]|nr:short chain dehydrogenase family protein [Aspergillus niger]